MMPDCKDYFSFYQLAPSLYIDTVALRKAYLEISRQFHPDYFVSDKTALSKAVEITAYNNKAYATLQRFESRLAYFLSYYGVLKPGEIPTPDSAFLMEMMDLNEELEMAHADSSAKEVLLNSIVSQKQQILSALEQSAQHHPDATYTADDLARFLKLYVRVNYLNSLINRA
jgi:molecular chaperone HscB